MADQLVEIVLPNGEAIWAKVKGPDGPQDVGIAQALELKGLMGLLRNVATHVNEATSGLVPQVCVEFGVELAVAQGAVVAALVGVGGKASINVTMTWGKGAVGQTVAGDQGE